MQRWAASAETRSLLTRSARRQTTGAQPTMQQLVRQGCICRTQHAQSDGGRAFQDGNGVSIFHLTP